MDIVPKLTAAALVEAVTLVKTGYSPIGNSILLFFILFPLHIVAFLTYNVVLYPAFFSPLRHLPGPKGGSWINGHGAKIIKEESGKPQLEWAREIPNDGLLYYRGLFNRERVMPTSSKTLREVLTDKSYIFIKPSQLQNSLGRLLGIGILLAEGDEHKRQRKILTPAFAPRQIRTLISLFWSKSQKMANTVTAFVNESGEKNPVVDYNAWSSRCALDIIGHAGFGLEFDAITNPNGKEIQTYRKVFQPSRAAMLLGILNQFLPIWMVRIIPVKRNTEIQDASNSIANLCLDQVKVKRQALREKKDLPPDILSIMVEDGNFNDEEMKNQLMTFMAAGHETTAASLTWCLYALARNPEMQTRLRNEVRAAIPNLDTGLASPEVIDSIRYLRNFCNEILRFYPPVPITLREASENTTLGGVFIPKGTTVLIAPSAVNKSKDFWGEDAEVFNPDRWEREGGAGGATSNYAMLTFLMGPRSCIGQKFAVEEFKCMTAALVGRFEFEEKEKDMEIIVKGGITARPMNGMPLKTRVVPGW